MNAMASPEPGNVTSVIPSVVERSTSLVVQGAKVVAKSG